MNKAHVMNTLVVDEGLRLKPYLCPAGKVTLGVGRNLDDKGITEREAFYLLNNDIDECYKDLSESVFQEFDVFPDPIQTVLISMRFQLGAKGFRGFKKMIKAFERLDYREAIKEMKDSNWYKQTPERADRLIKMVLG